MAVGGFCVSGDGLRPLPGTRSLCVVEKARRGLENVMPVFRDGIGNICRGEMPSSLLVEPEAARQERPRHGVLALIPLVDPNYDNGYSWVIYGEW